MRRTFPRLVVPALLILAAPAAPAADWPQFRGPSGMGQVAGKALPTEWDGKTGKNVLWKVPLDKAHNPYSSPIVVRDRVVLTISRQQPAHQHEVLCFAAADGKQLWKADVAPGPWKAAKDTGYPTPASDGERVYVAFGTAVIEALDLEGKPLWRHELDRYAFDVAMGSSPVLWGELVIVLCDQKDKKSHLIALDRKTGAVRYDVPRPEMGFAHSTPVVAKLEGGGEVLLVMASKGLQGIDPATGKVLWTCAANGDTASPVYSGKLAYADDGRGNGGVCVELPAAPAAGAAPPEKPAKVEPKWKGEKMPEALCSPVISGEYLYRLTSGDRLRCFRLATGETVYAEKLTGTSSRASPLVTPDGLVYFVSGGTSYVLRAGPTFDLVRKNDLGDANHASPAVVDGRIYVRGQKFLWCIGTK